MRIAVAQFNTRAGDFAHTSELIQRYAQNAHDCGADLLALPLTVLTGQFPLDYASREGFRIDLLQTLHELSQSVACPCLVPVVFDMDEEPINEIMLVGKDGISPLRSTHYLLWRKRHADEDPHLFSEFAFGGMRMALATTYEELDELLDSSERFDAVVYFASYGYALDDTSSALGASLAENRFASDAVSMDAWLVAVGPLGEYGTQTYTGASFVMAPNGALVASAPAFEEDMLVADITVQKDGNALQQELATLEPELYNRSLHLWETLVLGLRDHLQKQGKKEAALVLDGRLQSSLLAVLASDALGPTHVHALLGQAPDQEHAEAARRLVAALRVSLDLLPESVATGCEDACLCEDMTQAYLAQLARANDAMVLLPLDKTYLAVEAITPRCMAANLLPFGDVYRSDLIDLAHLRNTISPIIDSKVVTWFDVPAIEGLAETEANRELQLKRVDVTLATHLEWERSVSDVVARQGEREVTLDILGRFRACQSARDALPPSLVVSSRPVFAIRIPQGMAWQDRLRSEEERKQGKQLADSLLNAMKPAEQTDELLGDHSSFSNLLEGLEIELKGGSMPSGMDRETVEGAVSDLLGLIQDMLQDGIQPPSIEGPFGPLTWGSPFSEN
ncbi:MAG: nitrilase-related carbon-nitrogen hydrolase [Coriobacteriales bacterium]|nr:nitrilase-related carbon-nitrogen hydrolase [Coriobacteriales bacterium]